LQNFSQRAEVTPARGFAGTPTDSWLAACQYVIVKENYEKAALPQGFLLTILNNPTALAPDMVKRVYLAVSARNSMISIVVSVSGGVFLKGNGSINRLKL